MEAKIDLLLQRHNETQEQIKSYQNEIVHVMEMCNLMKTSFSKQLDRHTSLMEGFKKMLEKCIKDQFDLQVRITRSEKAFLNIKEKIEPALKTVETQQKQNAELISQNTKLKNKISVLEIKSVSYTHLRAHETVLDLVC